MLCKSQQDATFCLFLIRNLFILWDKNLSHSQSLIKNTYFPKVKLSPWDRNGRYLSYSMFIIFANCRKYSLDQIVISFGFFINGITSAFTCLICCKSFNIVRMDVAFFLYLHNLRISWDWAGRICPYQILDFLPETLMLPSCISVWYLAGWLSNHIKAVFAMVVRDGTAWG